LTLASALEKAHMDFLLLEGREQIAPFVGASIAITANGGRVLDQLNCYDAIHERTVPMDSSQTWKDGSLVTKNDTFLLGYKR